MSLHLFLSDLNLTWCDWSRSAVGVTTHGAFAEYCTVDSRSVAFVPQDMPFEQASPLACAGTTIYTAIKRAGLKPGQTLGIVGLGALGLLGVQMSQALGYKTVGIDSRPEPVELARSLSTKSVQDYLILQSNTPKDDALNQIQSMDSNKAWKGLDAVILATDAPESFEYGTALLRNHGTFVLVGQ